MKAAEGTGAPEGGPRGGGRLRATCARLASAPSPPPSPDVTSAPVGGAVPRVRVRVEHAQKFHSRPETRTL